MIINLEERLWEMIIKARFQDQDKYYEFIKSILKSKEIAELRTLTSLKELKTEFVNLNQT